MTFPEIVLDGVLGFPKLSIVKTKINTLPEAIEALKEVSDFMARFGASLGLSQPSAVATGQYLTNGAVPKGMSARVIQILSESGRPLKPKHIANKHQELGWPEPKGGRAKLYEAVSGSLSYLLNRKKVLTKGKKGYSIKKLEEKQ